MQKPLNGEYNILMMFITVYIINLLTQQMNLML